MEKETKVYSVKEINDIIASWKSIVARNAEKGISYRVKTQREGDSNMTIIGNENNKNAKGKRSLIIEKFNNDIDSVIACKDYVCLYCYVAPVNGGTALIDLEIPLHGGQAITVYKDKTSENESHQVEKKQPIQYDSTLHDAIKTVVGMMGYDTTKLNGYGSDNFSGLGAVMAIREDNITKRFEQADKDRRFEEMLTEKTKLESKVDELTRKLDEEQKYSDELEDKIEGLEEKIEDLEHLKPEYSVLGTSLVGIFEKAATNIGVKHAGLLGKLAGISEENVVTMLKNPQEPSAQTVAQSADVEVSPVGKHSEQITQIDQFLNLLQDDDFDALWQLMTAFSKDQTLINKALQSVSNE